MQHCAYRVTAMEGPLWRRAVPCVRAYFSGSGSAVAIRCLQEYWLAGDELSGTPRTPIPGDSVGVMDFFSAFTGRRAAIIKLMIDHDMLVPGVDMKALLAEQLAFAAPLPPSETKAAGVQQNSPSAPRSPGVRPNDVVESEEFVIKQVPTTAATTAPSPLKVDISETREHVPTKLAGGTKNLEETLPSDIGESSAVAARVLKVLEWQQGQLLFHAEQLKQFSQYGDLNSLAIVGPTGHGKSFLLSALLKNAGFSEASFECSRRLKGTTSGTDMCSRPIRIPSASDSDGGIANYYYSTWRDWAIRV